MGPFIVDTCKKLTDLPLDVHLMIERPERYIEDFVQAGANRVSVHIENAAHIHRTLELIKKLGAKPGIVINPGTAAAHLEAVIPFIEMVLVMTVNPGFGGQEFIPQMVGKIRAVRRMLDEAGSSALIEVDGGISAQTLPDCYAAGARVFVAGSSIFKHSDGIAAGVQALRRAVG
jgi:ribulose-phosphate 3-epimerase